jgi:N-acetylglucosamine kinase-like BadF-type ATPase
MTLLLGVDGGGTKTRAVLCRDDVVVGEGEGPSSNPLAVGEAAALEAIGQAIGRAAASANGAEIAAVCIGLAGVDREYERARIEHHVQNARFAPRAAVVHDSELVLAAGTPDGIGIGLVCGTGSLAFGRAPDGRRARAGGWGPIVDDEGSGYAIGAALLRAAARSEDGRRPAPAVAAAVREAFGASTFIDVVASIHRPDAVRADVARLAPIAFRLALAGDAAARAIIDAAADVAAGLIRAVEATLGAKGLPVALAGGLCVREASYRESICARLGIAKDLVAVVADPALGAVALARALVR